MKKLLIVLFITVCYNGFSQDLISSPYGDTVTAFRFDEKYLTKLSKSNKNLNFAILLIQKELDKNKAAVAGNNLVYTDDIAAFKTHISDAGLKTDVYDKEISFYNTYRSKRVVAKKKNDEAVKEANDIASAENEIRKKKSRDSFNTASNRADSIKRAVQKIKDDERTRVYDSTRKDVYAKEQKLRKADCIKRFGAKYGPIVANDDVVIGMNKAMVKDAWGEAETTNETVVGGIKVLTWEYSYKKWAIFKNGIVVSVNK